jgi:outer membrane protein TolC
LTFFVELIRLFVEKGIFWLSSGCIFADDLGIYYSFMKTKRIGIVLISCMFLFSSDVFAQFRTDSLKSGSNIQANPSDTSTGVLVTLDQALEIALSENSSVKIADKEIERTGYAKKGTYASLFPQVNLTGTYQRTIKKQVMYMDFDMSKLTGGSSSESGSSSTSTTTTTPSGGGIEIGRWNTYDGGVSANIPLINAQLWKSIRISGIDVELAVEKARSSRLDMVTEVKQSYYAVLLAKEALKVYKDVYDNAVTNFEQTQKRYNAQKASELDYTRAKSTVASAIPNVYDAESSVILALWQLKAVMGVGLDRNIDVSGSLSDYSEHMFYDIHRNDSVSLDYNTSMRQLAIQAEELAQTVKLQKLAYLPTLSLAFSYTMDAMTNDYKFSQYKWTPYSYAGLSLTIPIFSGGKRYNDVRQAKVQYSELRIQKEDTERQLRIAVRQYLNTMETKMKSYSSSLDAVATAGKAYDIASKSYEIGRSTITELNDAQLALTQSKLSVSQSIYDFLVAKSNLEKTLGKDFINDKGNTDFAHGGNMTNE